MYYSSSSTGNQGWAGGGERGGGESGDPAPATSQLAS